MSGEHDLACAVVDQALSDACKLPTKHTGNGTPSAIDIREARLFLTERNGGWARSREDWCALAGIEPEELRKKAVDKIAAFDARIERKRARRKARDEVEKSKKAHVHAEA